MDLMSTAQLLGNFGEFVGSIAILVTLVYLSIQVRKSQMAAEADSITAAQSNAFVNRNQLIANSDLLIRANAGEVLSDADELAFQALVESRNLSHFLQYRRILLVGNRTEAIAVLNWARFLVQNPAVYRQWNHDEESYQRARSVVGLPVDREWPDLVEQMVEKLRQAESETQT